MIEARDFSDGVVTSQAIAAAMEAASGVGGGVVLLPPGVIEIDEPLAFPSDGITIQGSGRGATILHYPGPECAVNLGRPDYDPTDPGKSLNFQGSSIRDLTVTGSPAGRAGVRLCGASRSQVERVRVQGFSNGAGFLFEDYFWIGALRDCRTNDNRYGVHAVTHSMNGANQSFNAIVIDGGEYGPGEQVGIMIGDPDCAAAAQPVVGSGIEITGGCAIEGAHQWGVWAVDCNALNIWNAYFENNGNHDATGHVRLGNANVGPRGVTIGGSWFSGSTGAGTGACIQIDRGEQIRVLPNTVAAFGGTLYGIRVTSPHVSKLRIMPQFMASSVGVPYDLDATDDYELERSDVAGYARTHKSGQSGWRWEAGAGNLHEFYDGQRVFAHVSRGGLPVFLADPDSGTGNIIEARYQGVQMFGVNHLGDARVARHLEVEGTLNHDGPAAGFFGAQPTVRPTITGSRNGNQAVASIAAALAQLGLASNQTTET